MASLTPYFWLIVGIVALIAGVILMAEFFLQFAKLIVGIILVVVGLQCIGFSRTPKVRVR